MQRIFLLDQFNNISLNVVLCCPDIPQNTGNIARLCVGTGAKLHLIKPFGFTLTDKKLKRAGLDYWENLDLVIYDSIEDFFQKNSNINFYIATTKAKLSYYEVKYSLGDFIMFGSETSGFPSDYISKYFDRCINIPMKSTVRSLNLSNSVAIVLYEALRQIMHSNN
ncbi:tRNA (cytidine/uridine-2'-O-)-methyltransferase [Desulfurella multipotens]|uniref:Putative tRNA (cytidine(34)-2'-O)-methyltransferase n=2 Tax=Desulfurella TaxID=33001 RepID=A0A1G6QZJ8_9BACT|nr:tRNA (cytidine(34)-2'-O)-methyltransferase [Desulfurella multipotens]SDC97414.1 tRNA (cytidine/uridine-2'-O-)-methyltransferase [Desulfurella multipotens]